MSYLQFAQTYDKLMDKSLYDEWAIFVKKYARNKGHILDVACGSGDLAMRLEKDYTVLACDISEDMLVLAQEKVKNARLFAMDMTQLTLQNNVDVVTCFADSLCYLDDEIAVQQAFTCAYNVLTDNGYYLFDVHSLYQMTTGYHDFHFSHVDDDSLFVWHSYPTDIDYSVVHEISCVNRLSNGLYERYDEQHFERTYPLESYIQWLKQVGFTDVQVFANFGKESVIETTTRWFFVCKK